MIAQDRQNEEANYEKQNRLGSTIFGYQSFFGGTLIFLLPPREMIHSSLKLWWDAEWKQMRACQRWQQKLISSRRLSGFWWERGLEVGPGVTQPAPLQHPTLPHQDKKVMLIYLYEGTSEVISRKVNQITTERFKITTKICKTTTKTGKTTMKRCKTNKKKLEMPTKAQNISNKAANPIIAI